jgi:hypothetical protein
VRKAEGGGISPEVINEGDDGHGYLYMRREHSGLALGTQSEALQELKSPTDHDA